MRECDVHGIRLDMPEAHQVCRTGTCDAPADRCCTHPSAVAVDGDEPRTPDTSEPSRLDGAVNGVCGEACHPQV
ncbi:hypothetical protein GCM10010458_08020 [Microbacterium luteolum]